MSLLRLFSVFVPTARNTLPFFGIVMYIKLLVRSEAGPCLRNNI